MVQWADTKRYLSPEASSVPGKWKTDMVEPARGPMLEVTNPYCHTITVVGCTQLLKTELINNVVAYFIEEEPSPMIVMQPDKGLAETWSKERFDKMVRDTPSLNKLVSTKAKGQSENTIWNKTYPGGQLNVIGARSPSELASRPVRVTLCDEVDKYPPSSGKEGDPLKLIEERTDTFWNKLNIRVCSPTIEGKSRIEQEFLEGDQRHYHLKCPHCKEFEKPVFTQVVYDELDIENTTAYECSHCKVLWSEPDRIKAISTGKYIASKPFKGHASFKVNKISSPWNPLSLLVKKFLAAQGDSEKLKTFYNTQMAETYKIKADAPDHMRLYERRENYNTNTITNECLFITAGVDVQGDRIELELVEWQADKQTYSVDYRVIPGNTSTPEPWVILEKVLDETWLSPNGRELKIAMMCVDTGYNTQNVYNWLRNKDVNRVRGIKGGKDSMQMIFGKPTQVELNHNGQRIPNALTMWVIGVSLIKGELYSWLKLPVPREGQSAIGFCHFPMYDETYFKGLCSEQLVEETTKNGNTIYTWQRVIKANEPLDTRVYNRCAASFLGIDRFTKEQLLDMFGINQENVSNSSNIGNNKEESAEENEFWNRNNSRKGRGFW